VSELPPPHQVAPLSEGARMDGRAGRDTVLRRRARKEGSFSTPYQSLLHYSRGDCWNGQMINTKNKLTFIRRASPIFLSLAAHRWIPGCGRWRSCAAHVGTCDRGRSCPASRRPRGSARPCWPRIPDLMRTSSGHPGTVPKHRGGWATRRWVRCRLTFVCELVLHHAIA